MTSFSGLALTEDLGPAVKVTPLLKTASTWDGRLIQYPSGSAEATGLLVELPVGGETGWHEHPVPSFAYVLQGDLEVQLRDGRSKRLHVGEAFAEVVNTPHNGRNVGAEPVKILVFYTGLVGTPVTLKHLEGKENASKH